MRKVYITLSILLIVILSIGLVACAPKNQEEDPEAVVMYADKEYTLNYFEDQAECRMVLDGNGHCSIYKKYSFDKPVDETQTRSSSYMGNSSKSFYFQYKDGEINFTDAYVFVKDGTLSYSGDIAIDQCYTFKEAIESGKTFTKTFNKVLDGMNATIVLKIKPVKYESGAGEIALGYTIDVPEFEKAKGEYEIVHDKYVKLKFIYDSDYPTAGLKSYQILPIGENYSTVILQEQSGRKNGHVAITVNGSNRRYVQLKDDGTFEFVLSSTTSTEQDLFTQDTYFGKSFTTHIEAIENGEGYTYDYKLTFDGSGNAKYECTQASMVKNFVADKEGKLTLLYYDIEEYMKLVGTHMDFGTSNNISFTNDFKVYVDYNYSRYTFEGDTHITIYRFNDCVYCKFIDGNGKQISVKFYDDGSFKWILEEFTGIDMSDHSDEI